MTITQCLPTHSFVALYNCRWMQWGKTVRVFFNHMLCRRRLTMQLEDYNTNVRLAGSVCVCVQLGTVT